MQALQDIRAEALSMGILQEAERDAQADIRNVLQAAGLKQVTFTHGD